MTNETLKKGLIAQQLVAEIEGIIARLQDPGFFVELHQSNNLSRGMSLIYTVGIGENCEHELAPFATQFHKAVLTYYAGQLELAKAALAAL